MASGKHNLARSLDFIGGTNLCRDSSGRDENYICLVQYTNHNTTIFYYPNRLLGISVIPPEPASPSRNSTPTLSIGSVADIVSSSSRHESIMPLAKSIKDLPIGGNASSSGYIAINPN